MLHYYPRHVSSINMTIFRRKNFILTASGIVAHCKRLYSTQCINAGISGKLPQNGNESQRKKYIALNVIVSDFKLKPALEWPAERLVVAVN